VLKSLINGLIQTYYRQNSTKEDFKKNAKLLFDRLLARGHFFEDIYPIFQAVANRIDEQQSTRNKIKVRKVHNKQDKERDDIFFHLTYHPRDISRKTIQEIYNKCCNTKDNLGESFQAIRNQEKGGTMRISKLTIAYNRAKNLRDLLCKSTLKNVEGCKASDFLPT
jgi:hypothetical protein